MESAPAAQRRPRGRPAQATGIRGPYICTHTRSGQFVLNITPPAEWTRSHQIVEITHLTDNPFDWLYTLEHATRLILLDSCFSNLVEQLNFPVEKSFIMRSEVRWTPVLRNSWERLGLPPRP